MKLTLTLEWKKGIQPQFIEDKLVVHGSNPPFQIAFAHDFQKGLVALFEMHLTEEDIEVRMTEHGVQALAWAYQFIRLLKDRGCLAYYLKEGGTNHLCLVPLKGTVKPATKPYDTFCLHPDVFVRPLTDGSTMEAPHALARAEQLSDTLMKGLYGRESDSELVQKAISLLVPSLLVAKESCVYFEQGPWQPHERYFHFRSRMGKHDYPYGGTYPGKQAGVAPLPIWEKGEGDSVQLPKPNNNLAGEDFFAVSERRRSIREYADRKLKIQELADFLYWSVRFKSLVNDGDIELGFRPVSSGGAIHEIEVCPCLEGVDGINDGLYRYNPVDHCLERLPADEKKCRMIIDMGWMVNGRQGRPPVVLNLTANMSRLAWKYESIAYSIVLKNVGVFYQQFYLVATALNLAPCALGGGDSQLFASISGRDPQAHPLVGEFILGPLEEVVSGDDANMDEPSADEIVRNYFNLMECGELETIAGRLSADFTHDIPSLKSGKEAFLGMIKEYHSAFEGWKVQIEELTVKENQVFVRSNISGQHSGVFLGHEASNKSFTVSALTVCNVERGKICKISQHFDTFTMLRQLGIG